MGKHSVSYQKETGNVIVKYDRYSYFSRRFFAFLLLLCLLVFVCGLYLVRNLGYNALFLVVSITFALASIIFYFRTFYVDIKNHRIEKNIIYPILDEHLDYNASKYPTVCKVLKRKLIDDPYKSHDEAVVVAFANGDYCEYPFRFISKSEETVIKELVLTQYVCTDERKILRVESRNYQASKSLNAVFESAFILFVGTLSILLMIFYSKRYGALTTICCSLIPILLFGSLFLSLKKYLPKNKRWASMVIKVLQPVFDAIYVFMRMILPTLVLTIVTIPVLLCTFLPPFLILNLINIVTGIGMTPSTVYFVSLVFGSFLIVYVPSYIRLIINKVPIIRNTEGLKFKAHVGDFVKYAYDANAVKFFFNCLYVLFIGILYIHNFQSDGPLVSESFDNVITKSFVVFLAFEGIRRTFKQVNLSASTFLKKLITAITDK